MFVRTLLPAALLLALTWAAPQAPAGDAPADSYIRVEIKGTVRTGIVAIGGETTGTLIATKQGSFELDTKNPKLRQALEKLDGKTAVVTGTLNFRKGVERGQRMVVTVTDVKAAK